MRGWAVAAGIDLGRLHPVTEVLDPPGNRMRFRADFDPQAGPRREGDGVDGERNRRRPALREREYPGVVSGCPGGIDQAVRRILRAEADDGGHALTPERALQAR